MSAFPVSAPKLLSVSRQPVLNAFLSAQKKAAASTAQNPVMTEQQQEQKAKEIAGNWLYNIQQEFKNFYQLKDSNSLLRDIHIVPFASELRKRLTKQTEDAFWTANASHIPFETLAKAMFNAWIKMPASSDTYYIEQEEAYSFKCGIGNPDATIFDAYRERSTLSNDKEHLEMVAENNCAELIGGELLKLILDVIAHSEGHIEAQRNVDTTNPSGKN